MPRKASSGDGTPTKTSAKGGAKQAAAAITADGSQILDGGQVTGSGLNATTTTTARGSSANKGVKRRRTSNNVNSNSGTEIYGSGTIVASNPFDDDHMPLSAANHNVGPPSNKMMMTMAPPSQQQSAMHPSMHHQANHLSPSPHHQPQHQHHHQQVPQHHQQHHHPMHHNHHHQPMYHQNNHHYHPQAMQQQAPLPSPQQQQPHGQIGTPPGHMPGVPHQGMPPMHNHHGPQMMAGYGPSPPQHQSHQQVHHPQGLPPPQQHGPQYHHQRLPPQPPQPHPTQNQMIGTSTPPQMMSAHPGPTHLPYNTTMQQGGRPMMGNQPQPQTMVAQGPLPPPAQAPVPLQQQQQPQQPQLIPPSHQHHQVDPMTMQQAPPLAPNQFGYCGKCQREVYKQEQHIICKAGCMSYFHISCSGLTQLACDLLMKESLAEWSCDRCTSGARVKFCTCALHQAQNLRQQI